MPNIFSNDFVGYRVFEFACALGAASRLFTLRQVARHPDLSWRTQPVKRAAEFLKPYAESFEVMKGPPNEPYRWRLSKAEKRKRGLQYTSINGVSIRSYHWLMCGDIWLELTFAGGRPDKWRLEWDGQFDIYAVWQGRPYLMEIQRHPITTHKWQEKWRKRTEWYRAQLWDVKPRVVLLDTTGQQGSTICMPKGTIHVKRIEDLPRMIQRSPGT